jgi:CRISPR-associated protein Cas2
MTGKRLYVVTYDIPDDRRRTRLHDRLLDYGSPVQYSVFECMLDRQHLCELKRMMLRTISRRRDHVRVYPLCATCASRVWTNGGTEVLGEAPPAIVV